MSPCFDQGKKWILLNKFNDGGHVGSVDSGWINYMAEDNEKRKKFLFKKMITSKYIFQSYFHHVLGLHNLPNELVLTEQGLGDI